MLDVLLVMHYRSLVLAPTLDLTITLTFALLLPSNIITVTFVVWLWLAVAVATDSSNHTPVLAVGQINSSNHTPYCRSIQVIIVLDTIQRLRNVATVCWVCGAGASAKVQSRKHTQAPEYASRPYKSCMYDAANGPTVPINNLRDAM